MKINKTITFLVLGLMLVGCVGFISYNNIMEGEDNMEEVYQGPVPQGHDLEHFRKTGETVKEDIE